MSQPSLRLDKWLWFARFARTRSLAAQLCATGRVAIAGVTAQKPHHPVRVGDVLTIEQGRLVRRVTVLALGERRGPAPEARGLYEERDPPAPSVDEDDDGWVPLLDQ